jgi:hypothetical protein
MALSGASGIRSVRMYCTVCNITLHVNERARYMYVRFYAESLLLGFGSHQHRQMNKRMGA